MRNSSLNRSLSKYRKITLQRQLTQRWGWGANARPLLGQGDDEDEIMEK